MIATVPTIIVGLGGIGSEIVEQLEKKTRDRDSITRKYRRDNIQFVIVDTDENSIRERKRHGYTGYSVTLSGDVSVRECLEWDKDARDSWFPQCEIFMDKSIAEGAGQVRAISRLAFQRALRIGRLSPLYAAIEELFKLTDTSTEQGLKIVLVSTIAGGTGSGLILPLAMHLKKYVKKKYSNAGVKINAALILPDVLEGLKSSNSERDNLYANGYAALKEISNFMHVTDNGSGNKDLVVKLPNDEGHALFSHRESPFDFCFLFGKLNMDRKVLGNLREYEIAVGECLYTQFIGSYSSKYFSNEDNMVVGNITEIKEGSDKKGKKIVLSRFAAANSFRVCYPYEKIANYLALNWALESMEHEWVKYDKEVKAFVRKQRELKEKGMLSIEKSSYENFADAVENARKKGDENAKDIFESCSLEERGLEEVYIEKFDRYVIREIREEQMFWDRIEDETEQLKGKVPEQNIEEFFSYYSIFEKEIKRIENIVTNKVSYEVFKNHENEEEWKNYYIEYYFKNVGLQSWKSPNEIRYFLCRLVIRLNERYREVEKILNNEQGKFDGYKADLNKLEYSDDRMLSGGRGRRKKVVTQLKSLYVSLLHSTDEVLRATIMKDCYLGLSEYVRGILEAYDKYFDEFEEVNISLGRKKEELEKRLNSIVQGTEQLVCSDAVCLKALSSRMKDKRVYYQVGGEVSEQIYHYCNQRFKDRRKVKNRGPQEKEMEEMWKRMFYQYYAEDFDVDLFEAFFREAEYTQKNINPEIYIEEKLERAAKKFAVPILTLCRKDMGDGVFKCVYPISLDKARGYWSIKNKYFHVPTAVCDDKEMDTDKRSIVFYQNRYGLEPFYVDFFGSKQGVNNSFPLGAGYCSYCKTLERITGTGEKAKITPHIDNSWHRREIMSDIDRERENEYVKWIIKYLYVRSKDSEKKELVDGLKEEINDVVMNYYIWNFGEVLTGYWEGLKKIQEKPDESSKGDIDKVFGFKEGKISELSKEAKVKVSPSYKKKIEDNFTAACKEIQEDWEKLKG